MDNKTTEEELSLQDGCVFTITKEPNSRNYNVVSNGVDYSDKIDLVLIEEAFSKSEHIVYKDGKFKLLTGISEEAVIGFPEVAQDKDFIHMSPAYKPNYLVMPDLHWKFLIRNVIKGKNILMVGYTGSAKTTFAREVSKLLNRPFFKIPLGASQDPRSILIGNTFYSKERGGTFFQESEFVRAIQTPNAVILLDEFSRAHPDVENILMTVLDHQRYLRLDEHEEQLTINVAPGVCFIATANIGNEYTATRVIDRASKDRFLIIQMALLTQEQEFELLKLKYPNVDESDLNLLTTLTSKIRTEFLSDDKLISNMVSTRMAEEIAEALEDNFTLAEALEVTVLPLYDDEGNESSERTRVKNIIDSIIGDASGKSFIKSKLNANNIFNQKMKSPAKA